MKAVKIKSLKVKCTADDYIVTCEVEDTGGCVRDIVHSCARNNVTWEQDYNDLISAVIREARDFS
jgi:hypothetical protein